MNKVYKVVWNASLGAWVATSELAKSKTKTKSKILNLSAAVLVGAISFSPTAFAATNIGGGSGSGTSISGDRCGEGTANTSGSRDIAIGCGAQTQGTGISNIANRQNPYNNSTGAFAGAQKQGGSISLGTGATTQNNFGTAIGSYATTTDIAGVAIGTAALSKGNTSLAIGRQSAATADFAQAIGNVAAATGKGSLAIGHSATAEGYRSIAIGSPDIENAGSVAGQAGASYQPNMATKATGKDSIAFGGGAVATQENSLAIGAFSASTGKKSVAIGTGAKANKDNAVVIGDQAEAAHEGGVAIGKGARSDAENSIALGKDSKATQATGESFLTKRAAPTGVLSVGDVGVERRIQNVADGAADSDAATVGQLKAARSHYVSINDSGTQGGNFENDGATGRNAIAVGVNATAAGRDATAIGSAANATDWNSVALGANAKAAGTGAISMGASSNTVGQGDIAIGRNASTQGASGLRPGYSNQSIAIGDQTKAIGDQSIAIGADVIARGNSSVAIGGDDVDKIAQDAELSKTYTDITGGVLKAGRYPTTEANHGSTAVGTQAVATGAFSSAFGMTSKATGDASSAFGVMANASGKGAAAFGAVSQATGDGAAAMGINSLASGTNSTAIGSGNKPGEGAKATGNGAAAIGSGAQATGDNAAAIGKDAEASNENAAAVGGGAKATGKNSAAIGGGSIADQENAVAVGQGAQSLVVGGVALGARSRVDAENSVALGQDAIATEATGSSFLTNRDASMSNGVISVGSAGKERRITNVEDGSVDSDAVTVRQLKNVDTRVSQNTQNITNLNQKIDSTKKDLGNQIVDTNKKLDDTKQDLGNQIKDTNNKLNDTKDQLTTQITDTKTELNNTINNTKTELNTKIDSTKTELENKGLNFAGNTGTDVHRKLGDKLNIVGGADAATLADKTSGENVITRTTKDGIQIELLKDAKFDSITTGDSVLNNNGLTIKDGASITKDGINAGNKVITNVADGVNGKDAVNVDQLTKVKDGLDGKITDTNSKLDDVKKDLGNQIVDTNKKLDDTKQDFGNQIKDTNNKLNDTKDQLTTQITDTKTELNNTINNTKTELNTKIDSTKTELENKGLIFAGNAGADVHRKLGDKLNIVGGADTTTSADKTSGENVITRTTKDGIQIELLKDAKFDSITTGDSVLNNNGLTIKDGASITKDGINAGNKVISNVADGAITNGSKDAVNGGQVKNISDSIKNSIGGNTTVNPDSSITTNNIGGTGKNNIHDAIKSVDDKVTSGVNDLTDKGLNFAGNTGTDVHRKLGDKLNIVGGADAATSIDKTSGENVITRTTADGIQIELLKDAKFDSITTGDSVLNNNGLTIKDGASITKDGINAGNKVITNVADGVNGKDAVNVDQLTKVKDGLDGKITDTNSKLDDAKKDLGNQIVDTNKKLDDTKQDLGNQIKDTNNKLNDTKDQLTTQITDTKTELNNTINNTKTELNTKIDSTKTELENKGLIFAGNAGADVHRKLGDKLNIVGGADAATPADKTSGENVITRTTKDGIQIELLKDAKFDSITTGDSVLNNNGLTIKDGASITKDGINAGNKVISNVADGLNSKDAVNKGQLDQLAAKQKDSDDSAVKYNDPKSKDKVTLQGKDGTTLDNVKDGHISADSKEAVNGGQIHNIADSIKNSIGGNTTVNPDGSITTNNIGGTGKHNINDAIAEVKDSAIKAKTTVTEGDNVVVKETTNKDGSTNFEVSTKKDLTLDSITTGDTVLNNNGLTIKDGASITKDGINAGNKKITNVTDGAIANGSKEAVNGGQIQNISDSIKNSIGGNTTVNPDGSITTNNIGGTGKNNINDAIKSVDDKVTNGVNDLTNKGLNFGANDQKASGGKSVHRKLGDTLNIVGGADADTAEDKTSGENIITRTTEDGVKIELLKDAKFDSITTGNTVLNNNGLTIKGGPSITINGIDAGAKKITNVADGVDAKDAVNKGQLDKQISDVKDQIGKQIGDLSDHAVKYDKDKDGNVDKNSVTLGGDDKGTNLKNVADGKVAEGSKDAVNGGQLWNVQKQVDQNSNDIQNIQNNIENINNGKSGLVQQQKPSGEITVGKDTGGTSINMAGKDGNRVIQGVKDGEIKAGSNHAVNGDQIHNISESIKNSIGGNTSINADGSITTKDIGGTGKNNINDAIGALNQSNQDLGNKINNLGDQLQQVFYDTNKRIDNLEDKMSAGIAATAALEQAPFVPGKLTMAVGAAYYNDQNAVGVTFRRTADNGRWSLTTGAALGSQGSPLVRIGVSTIID
ncbi:trimeric autotransporter adhesin Ata [Acinetobacter venetianus]|uniref:trimeric autotransporter adhesin Ata n=1 Tax=Acinetobacter venetianus TaxID=52133 RepID=UPI00214FC91D|nr:trimeric autotransporter adhesin Ata [Acinetobacter venetianus]MCR4531136.1 trimeric autotransporter adhesin Ata [Acinetobacter venetianus]